MPEYWWPTVSSARWFRGRGKNGRITQVEPLPWYTQPGQWPAIRSEIVTVSYPNDDDEQYHLVVGYLDQTDEGRDIAAHPGLLRLLWAAWCNADENPLTVEWTHSPPANLLASPFTGEQSHSSVLFGDQVMVKFYRRLVDNPETDVLRKLSRVGSTIVPGFYGSISAVTPHAGPVDLVLITKAVPHQRQGWEAATGASAQGLSFSEQSRALGADVRRLHTELAQVYPTGTVAGSELIHFLAQSVDSLGLADPLASMASALLRTVQRRDWPDVAVQRLHADLHLGQCLDTDRGWVFVDFEGEPLRTHHDRRRGDCVWRDNAGMLRSLDYASRVTGDPEGNRQWFQECVDAYLDGYGESPDAPLGRLYELEKAVYEVAYEVSHRPQWVDIPRQAVVNIGLDVAGWAAPGQEWEWHTILPEG